MCVCVFLLQVMSEKQKSELYNTWNTGLPWSRLCACDVMGERQTGREIQSENERETQTDTVCVYCVCVCEGERDR